MREAFDKFDRDRSGKIERSELKPLFIEILKLIGLEDVLEANEETINNFLEAYDTDKSGTLSRGEVK